MKRKVGAVVRAPTTTETILEDDCSSCKPLKTMARRTGLGAVASAGGSERSTSIFNNFESSGGIVGHGSAMEAGLCVPPLGLLADLFGVTYQRADHASWIVSPLRAAIKRATFLGRKNV
jgi:hypothetical protein